MKALIDLYLEYSNDYLTLAKFAEHKEISLDLAALIVNEGRIHHELKVHGFSALDTAKQAYLEIKMSGERSQ